jgi:hypothetical protein
MAFLGLAYFGHQLFGDWFAPMPAEDLHILVEAALILVAANTLAFLGLYFNFRGLWRFWLNDSKNAFNTLLPWQKIAVTLLLYFFFFAAYLICWQIIA